MNTFTLDFIGIGAQKAGTTWVADYLAQHPDICLSEPKEVHYFNRRTSFIHGQYNPNADKPLKWYWNHFAHWKKGQCVGEFSTDYSLDEEAPQRIHELFPKIKIIFCLRNPVDRAYSQYWMYRSYFKQEQCAFEDAVNAHSEYIERGLYYQQLERYSSLFSRDQIKVILFDDIQQRPNEIMQDLCNFLGLDFQKLPVQKRGKSNPAKRMRSRWINCFFGKISRFFTSHGMTSVVRCAKKMKIKRVLMKLNTVEEKYPPMDAKTREKIIPLFEQDIHSLENLIGRDLSGWRK